MNGTQRARCGSRRTPMQQPRTKAVSRKLIAGEVLMKPGERPQFAYIIQNGCIALCNSKAGRYVEISRCYSPASIGDEAVFGPVQWNLTAIAVRDTTVLEIPLPMMQNQLQASNPFLPSMMKALSDRAKSVFG